MYLDFLFSTSYVRVGMVDYTYHKLE